ncbi:MAG: type II secretion system F family protein, partial [Nitrospinota bacterium]
AMRKHPEMFSSTFVNLVAASEQGGFLHAVLKRLTEMEANREKLRSILISAFSYPFFLTLFSLSVTIFILVFVFPKFEVLFSSIQDQLPFTTVVLMGTSYLLKHNWYFLLALLVIFLYASLKWTCSAPGKETLASLKLKLPFIKNLFIRLYLIQLLRTMGLSLENGVSIIDALKSSREIIDNALFREFVGTLESDVLEGKGVATGFEVSELIPSMVKQMISTGEESGNLPLVMNRVADFYEGELEKKLELLSKVAEPVMLLVMGLVVGVLVSSLILPIFKLSRVVH